MNPQEVLSKVQSLLSEGGTKLGMEIDVLQDQIKEDDGYWNIPVRPKVWPKRTSPFYEMLANIEGNLCGQDIPVLLIPVMPD